MRVKTDRLNLRSEPRVMPETRIAALPLGLPVRVLGSAEREGWVEVEALLDGDTLRGVLAERYLREPESDAKEALLDATVEQWLRFERGVRREDESPQFVYVGEMWRSIGLELDGRDRDIPWSAAFISFVARRAGYTRFGFAAAHSRYIHASIAARSDSDADSPFWGMRSTEHRPRLGDLVCLWRFNRCTFDDAARLDAFKSHCDVVVEIRNTFVRVIGGNVGSSVRMRTFSLDGVGFVADRDRIFAILRNNR